MAANWKRALPVLIDFFPVFLFSSVPPIYTSKNVLDPPRKRRLTFFFVFVFLNSTLFKLESNKNDDVVDAYLHDFVKVFITDLHVREKLQKCVAIQLFSLPSLKKRQAPFFLARICRRILIDVICWQTNQKKKNVQKEIQMNIPRCCYTGRWVRDVGVFFKTRRNFSENDLICYKWIKHVSCNTILYTHRRGMINTYERIKVQRRHSTITTSIVVQEVEMYTIQLSTDHHQCFSDPVLRTLKRIYYTVVLYMYRWTLGKKSGWRVFGRFVNGRKDPPLTYYMACVI